MIDTELASFVDSSHVDEIRSLGFIRGDIRLRVNDIDGAIDQYLSFAEAAPSQVDSLYALISANQATRLQMLQEGNQGKNGSYQNEQKLAEIEKNIGDLYRQIRNGVDARTSQDATPATYVLSPPYPNPFNPTVTIPFGLPVQGRVKLAVYNVIGQKVATLVDETKPAGYHRIVWNGCNDFGVAVSSGIYFARMDAKEFTKTQKIAMIK